MTRAATSSLRGDAPPPEVEDTADRRSLRVWACALAVAVAAVPFLAEAWFLLRAPRSVLVTTMPDDAFYYLEIGQRAARGEGFTFDGVHATSGYHPMWQWLVTGVEWIVPGETAQVRAVRLFGLVVVAAAFALTTRVLWRGFGPLPALGGLLLASHSVASLRYLSGGMETPVVLLGLALCLAALDSYHRAPDRRRAFLVGLAGAFLVLARLDMAVILPIAALSVALRTPRRRNLSGWAAGCAAIGVPYLAYHLLAHRSLLTTSATVKQYWVSDHVDALGGWFAPAHLRELASLLGRYGESIMDNLHDGPVSSLSAIGFIAIVTLALLGTVHGLRDLGSRRGRLGPTGTAAATLASTVVTKLVFDLVFMPLWFLTWYAATGQVPAAFAIGAAAGAGVGALERTTSRRLAITVAVLAVLAVLPSHLDWVTTNDPPQSAWQVEIDRAADWLLENRPPGAYGAFDAGLLGYRLDGDAPVVNLDGLVNDRDFAEYLASRPDRLEMARREGIDIIVNDLDLRSRQELWSCATTLYEGTVSVDDASPRRDDRIWVLDLSSCG